MKKKEIINKIISMLTIFALIIPIASQVKAADPVKGIEVNADSTELDKAVKDGKASGLDITEDSKQDKGSVNSNAEADAKLAEINADYKAQVQKIKAAKAKMDDYNAKKAKYDKEKEKYDKDLAKYNEDYKKYLKDYEDFKKQYDEEKKKMDKALEEYKKHKDEEGYLSSPYAKTLVYDSEPDAELTLSDNQGNYITKKAVDTAFSKTDKYSKSLLQLDDMSVKELEAAGGITNKMELYGNFGDKASWKTNVSENGTVKWATVLLQKGQSVTATYTNLKKTYYNGKKISKIVFKYTVTSDSAFKNGKMWLGIFTDPTLGVFASAYTGENEKNTSIFVKNEFTFYDQDGNPVEFQDALMSVASLNREHNSIELAKDYKAGQFVKITGSTVGEDKDRNLIYATESLNFRKGEGGCKHTMYKRDDEPDSGWDTADAKNSWYGAGVVRLQGKSNYITLGATSATNILPAPYGPIVPKKDNTEGKKPNIWYSLNGKVRAVGIPEIKAKEPNKPVKPTPPEEPQKPETKITYHHSVFYVKSQVEKKALNENNKDINNSVVKTGSVVNFELNTSDFPKGHEKIESLVFTDTLPKGYELDLDGTKAKNSDYDVEYTKETGLLKFTAKTSLLEKINNDLTKDAKVPSPKITGKVTKEGTKYENKFTVSINNVYNVESKPVKVYTPTEPKKDVFKGSDITSIDGKIVEAGQELRYEITYKNTTGTKQTVTITDKIPQYTKFVSADNDGTENGGTVKWVKEVEDGNSITVSFKVKVDDDVNGKPIDNISHVKDGFNESDTNETHNPTPTKPKKEVFDSKNDKVSIDGNEVKAGQELLYKVTYKNTTGTKQTVTITDKIPEHTTFVSADNDGTENSGTIKWVKEVENGDSITVSFKVKVNDNVNGQKILNKANVVDGNNKFDTNETTNPTSTKPKKDVFDSKDDKISIDGNEVKAGQELLYKVTYKNTTGKDQKVVIKDKIPEHTTYVKGSASNKGVYKDGEITWTKEKVADGEIFEVTFKVKVNDDVNGEKILNKANVVDGNNKFDTNETTNPTSTKPKKDVFDSQNDKISIDGNEVKAGQELLYKITYKNTTGTKQTVTITDKIPEHTTFVSADNDGVYKDGEITWTKEKVADGETFEVTFKVKVNDNVNGEKILNKANVVEGNNNYDTNETTNPTPTKPVKDVFDSQDNKVSINGNEVKAGQELLYKVTYKNTTGKEQKVVIKDKIPEYTTYVEGSADNGGVYKDGEITWTKEKVADGETFEVTFKVKVNDNVNGEKILNKANVVEGNNNYDTNETTNPTPTKPVKDVFDSQDDIAPSQLFRDDRISIDGNEVKAGQELLYKVTYKNTTGKDQKVVIKDKIPEHTTYVEGSADNDGVYKDGEITWTKEKVADGETFEVTFKVKVNDNVNGEKILNKANIVEGNNNYETNETTNPTSTKPKKDVFSPSDDKVSIDGNEVKAGQELLYKVTYKNTTGKDQKVVIKDKIPEHTTYVEGSASDDGVYKDGEITWTKEKVADGETFEVTFKVKVNDNVNGEKILNKANVVDGNNEFDTNETTNPTPTKPKKDVFSPSDDKVSIDGNEVKAGQELLYKVTYKNTTGKDQKVVIKDKIPEHTTYVEGSADNGGVYKDGEITWTKDSVSDGETFEVTFKVKVNDNVNGEKILNKANVVDGSNKFDTNETTNPTPTKPVKDVFSPSDDKVSIDGNEVKAGQELLYKVTYKNTTGKDQKVVIKDKIPEHTTYVENSADNGGVYKDGEITWTKDKVADGETFEVTFKVKVNDNVNGEKILNKANVVDGNNKFDTNETTNPTPTKPVKDVFDSQDNKVSIDGNEVKAGQELLYKVTYKNTTGKDQKVVIKDKIPEHTTYVKGSASNKGVYKDGEITWTKEKVADGEIFEVTFKVKVNDDVNGEKILNKANVVDGNNKFDTNETTNPTSTKPKKDVFDSQNDKISIDGNEVKAGQELLYKVTYKNTTGKDQKVVIKDKIPEHTTYVEGSADNGGVYKDGEITWTKDSVSDGETFEVTFKVKVNDNVNGEKILNKANVVDGSNKFDTNETTNPTPTKPVKDVFSPSDDKVSIDGNEVKAGQELLYKVTYKNTTGKDQKVVIKDKIPEHTTYVENSADNGGVYKDGEITWTKDKVADGETFEVTFKVKVNDNVNGEKILNKANVVDGNNKFDTNETTNPTPTKPKKDVFSPSDDKVSIDGNEVKAGQELLYKVTYKNTTGKDQKVVIKDKIPEHTTYVEGSADNDGVYKDGEITWTKEKVADGETFEVTFKVKVNDNVNGEKILNKANVIEGNNNYDTNETTNPTPLKPRPVIPKTGYAVNTALYTVLLGLSTGALGAIKIRYKKKNKK